MNGCSGKMRKIYGKSWRNGDNGGAREVCQEVSADEETKRHVWIEKVNLGQLQGASVSTAVDFLKDLDSWGEG